jgi:hypothetical protein
MQHVCNIRLDRNSHKRKPAFTILPRFTRELGLMVTTHHRRLIIDLHNKLSPNSLSLGWWCHHHPKHFPMLRSTLRLVVGNLALCAACRLPS